VAFTKQYQGSWWANMHLDYEHLHRLMRLYGDSDEIRHEMDTIAASKALLKD